MNSDNPETTQFQALLKLLPVDLVTTTDVNGDGTLLQQAVDRKKDFVRILLEFGFVSLFLGFSFIPN